MSTPDSVESRLGDRFLEREVGDEILASANERPYAREDAETILAVVNGD